MAILKDRSKTKQSSKAQKISQHIRFQVPLMEPASNAFNPSLPGFEHERADVINWKLRYLISGEHESQK